MDFKINTTYSLVKVCRICLQNKNNEDGSEQMTEIMETTIVDALNISLLDLFLAFTALPMDQTKGFPTQICKNCQEILVSAYEFQLKCIKSDQDIRMALLQTTAENNSATNNDECGITDDDSFKTGDNAIFFKEHCFDDSYENIAVKDELESIQELPRNEIYEESEEKIVNEDSSNKVRKIYKNKMVKCEICNRTFNKSYNLLRHLKVHETEGKPFECQFCKRRFAEEKSMITHTNSHKLDDLRRYEDREIDSGNNSTDDEDDDTKIMKIKNKLYKCLICNKSFDKSCNLVRHSNVHNPEGKPFECKICKRRFAVESRLICHQFLHKPDESPIENNTATDSLPVLSPATETTQIKPRKKSHVCLVCNKSFVNQTLLQVHSKIHDPDGKPFQCNVCKKRFAEQNSLIRHELNHSKDLVVYKMEEPKFFQCTKCPREFLKKESLALHGRVHRNNQSPGKTCDYCQKTFFKLFNLKRHIKIHISTKQYRCRRCDKTFTDHGQLVEHRKNHNESTKHNVCSICNKSYSKLSTLKDHMLVHNGETPYLCSVCGKSFSHKATLAHHMIIHSNKRYECSICSVRMSTKAHLKWHMVTHTGIKAYTCDTCGKSFTRPDILKNHIKQVHTTNDELLASLKSHLCTFCDMKFQYSYKLTQHMRTHTGEKPFKCELCDRAFAQNGDLTKHRRLHVGYDIYKCKECPATFKKYADLRKHNQNHYFSKTNGNENNESKVPL